MLRNLFALFLAFFLCACASNHDFRRSELPNGAPDVAVLKAAAANAKVDQDQRKSLHAVSWIPLVKLDAEGFAVEHEDGYPTGGHKLGRVQGWGPLYCALDSEEWHWDENDALFEREERFHVLWGLYRKDVLHVRTDRGWRSQTKSRWLWFFGGSDVEYTTSKVAP